MGLAIAVTVASQSAAFGVPPREAAPGHAVLQTMPGGGQCWSGQGLSTSSGSLALADGTLVRLIAEPVSSVRTDYYLLHTAFDGSFSFRSEPLAPNRYLRSPCDFTLASDGERIAVAWQAERPDVGREVAAVYLRTFDRDLRPLSPVIRASGSSLAHRYDPALAVNGDSVFVAFPAGPHIDEPWQRTALFGRTFDWSGNAESPAERLDVPPLPGQLERGVEVPLATLLPNGDVVVTWMDRTGGESTLGDVHKVSYRIVFGSLVKASEETILGPEDLLPIFQAPTGVVALVGGGYVITWDSGFSDVWAQVFEENHQARTEPFRLRQGPAPAFDDTVLETFGSGLSSLADGGFVASWTAFCTVYFSGSDCDDRLPLDPLEDGWDGDGWGTFVRSFDASGQPLGPSRRLAPRVEGDQIGGVIRAMHSSGPSLDLARVPAYFEDQAEAFVRALVPECELGPDTACSGLDGRFRVEAKWRDFEGNAGVALVQQQEDRWASFSFFEPGQIDLVVKLVDARSFSGNHWVFLSSLSNAPFEVSVLDTLTGHDRIYRNPFNQFRSLGDVGGLPELEDPDFDAAAAGAGAFVVDTATRPAPSVSANSHAEGCVPSQTRLCFLDRFAVDVLWTDFEGDSGVGRRLDIDGDSQAFWFFEPDLPELTIKILDARAINGRFWVFFGSLSNVDFRLTVTDVVTDQTRTWHNTAGNFASVGDTRTFAP